MKNFSIALIFCLHVFSNWIFAQDVTFQKSIGGNWQDYANSVQPTNDGGYIMTGTTESFGAGDYDVYLLKTDGIGNIIWTKTFGGSGYDEGYSVKQTNDNGYMIVGETDNNMYIIKTDANGDTLWTKAFGGDSLDWAKDFEKTSDGGYIIVGSTQTYETNYEYNIYLIKMDSLGNILWNKIFGGQPKEALGSSVKQLSDGGYIIAGGSGIFGGSNYTYLIKTDASGDTLWTKAYTDSLNYYYSGGKVLNTIDSGFVIGSFDFFGNHYLMKLNFSGEIQWSKKYLSSSYFPVHDMIQTSDGGYLAVAGISLLANDIDISLIMKNDSLGNVIWAKEYNGGAIYSINFSTDDNGFIASGFTQYPNASGNVFLIKIDSMGQNDCYDSIIDITASNYNPVIWDTASKVSSGLTLSYFNTIVGSGGDSYDLCFPSLTTEEMSFPSFNIYPNPSKDNISFDQNFPNASIQILNILGQKVYSGKFEKELDVSFLHKGIYIVELIGEKTYRVKFVKE